MEKYDEDATDHPNEQLGPKNGLNQFTPLQKQIHVSCLLLANLPPRFSRFPLVPDFQTQSRDSRVPTTHALTTTKMGFREKSKQRLIST